LAENATVGDSGDTLCRVTEGVGVHRAGAGEDPVVPRRKRRGQEGTSDRWIVKTTGVVNRFSFYCVDSDFGPFFMKFCSCFSGNARRCINGNHWARKARGPGSVSGR